MPKLSSVSASCVLATLSVTWPCAAADLVDFQREIQPLLAERCGKCHGAEKQQGGLRLDIRSVVLKGGDSGEPAIVPGHADQSRLYQLVVAEDENERMPPEGEPLTAAQTQLLKRWIDTGASWPESPLKSTHERGELVVTDADRQHWSFRPLQPTTPPQIADRDWVRSPIDLFIRYAQEEKGELSPTGAVGPRQLVRRLYFDLIGLPPVWREERGRWSEQRLGVEVDLTAAQLDEKTLLEIVDRLLESPHYGERWARHWLDVARYADSNGQEGDADRPYAFQFRDFVIRALNEDLPFDTFVRWQLAGDELEPENPQAIAATGFLVAGNSTMLNVPMEEEKLRNRANELDDMISTTGQAFLGMTLGCARCHDHKYDAIPTRDYYSLMCAFNSGDRTNVPLTSPAQAKEHREAMAAWQKDYDAAAKERDDWLKKAREPVAESIRLAKIAQLPIGDEQKKLLADNANDPDAKALANRFKKELKIEDAEYVRALSDQERRQWEGLDRVVRGIESRKPEAVPLAFAFADFSPQPKETWFFERGDFLARNERMELGFLRVLTKGKSPAEYWQEARDTKRRDDSTQQRSAIANWITDLDRGAGALLARVMVNRIWQHHFGDGLVRTVNDFGTRGELPTHPELLEWLASEFVQNDWSIKHLHRLIVTSATYRQGTDWDAAKGAIDPDNRLVWRRRPRRLEAEALRDSMLAVAGTLNGEMYGPSFKPPIAAEAMQARNVKDPYPREVEDSAATRRRTVYMFHKRVVQYPLVQAFDAPDAQVSCGRRVNTTVAPQALALLNDPFVRRRADEFAERLVREAGDDVNAQIELAFHLALGREPSAEDRTLAGDFLQSRATARATRSTDSLAAHRLALTDFCQALFGLNEFLYVD